MYLVQIIVAKQITDVLCLYVHKFHATPIRNTKSILRPQYHFHRSIKIHLGQMTRIHFKQILSIGMYILFQKLT